MGKKTNLEGTICRASDCCGATLTYKLGDIGFGGEPNKNAKFYCINCNKECECVEYILIRKDKVKTLTVINNDITGN